MTLELPEVSTATDARSGLNTALKRFRHDGIKAQPLVFGSHRKPEAIVIPYALFERLLPAVEEILIEETIRERLTDGSSPIAFDDAARSLGFDPHEF